MTLTDSTARTFAKGELRSHVEAELERDVNVPSGCVTISVTDRMITLSGSVGTRAHRIAAVEATHRVGGVHTIVDDIVVLPAPGASEHDVAVAVESVLKAIGSSADGLNATVRDGVITLTGRVDSQIEKTTTCRAIGDLRGVRWVENHVVVEAGATAEAVHARIVAAAHQSADEEGRAISLVTRGHEVWLSGEVASPAIRTRAVLAAWSTPGVKVVHDDIRIGRGATTADGALRARIGEVAGRALSPLVSDGRGCTS